MVKFARIPAEIKNLDQWVCVSAGSKAPMRAWEYQPASSTDPKTWSFFEQAVCAVEQGFYDNIGFVFADNGIVGIDIDIGYDADGFLSQEASDIIGRCRSYTEKSRSGRGFHILLKGNLPFAGKNNHRGIEIYKAGRYFITTGDVMLYDAVVEDQDAIDYVVSTYFPEEELERESTDTYNPRIYHPQWVWNGNKIPLQPTYPAIRQGSRNLSLLSVAGQLRSAGYSKAQIYTELKRCNDTACQPPLGNSELQTIVNSVARYKR